MSEPSWEAVRARSLSSFGGLSVYCGDCGTVFPHSGLPCRKHATPDELERIEDLLTISAARIASAMRGAHE